MNLVSQDKKKEIFNYNNIIESAWSDLINIAKKFQNIRFDLENDDSMEKKIIYIKEMLRKDQPIKYQINCDLRRAGGDWESAVFYFRIEFVHDYGIKKHKCKEKPEYIWDTEFKNPISNNHYVIIPPVEVGNVLKKTDDGWVAYGNSDEDKVVNYEKDAPKNCWKWLVNTFEKLVKERHERLDENKKNKIIMSEEKIKGGLADGMTITDLAKKHGVEVNQIKTQLIKGIKVEYEHTNDPMKAKEIAKDHIFENPEYYDKLEAIESDTHEATCSGAAGSFSAPMGSMPITKREIYKQHNKKEYNREIGEATTTDVSANGQYDVPFGTNHKDSLAIDGSSSIKKSRAVKDKKFPKFGGDSGVYVKIKEKCKKFPYCNQGDINALELYEMEGMKEIIDEASKKFHLTTKEIEEILLNEIKQIFI